MLENDESKKIIRKWIRKAENDLKNATFTLQIIEDCPTDTICFHAQQCVEKYIKALLIYHKIDFPKTHNIDRLISLLAIPGKLDITKHEMQLLTDYAIESRYPDDFEDIPYSEAEKAVTIAKRIRKQIRKLLPKEVLQKK